MRYRRAGLNGAPAPKICGSGWKRTVVPRRLDAPSLFELARSARRANSSWRPERAVARHLDRQPVGQRVDHRDADAVQAARGLVGPENLPPECSVVMITSSADLS
jgi:hypothetical protein